ncbi:hypothetical protein CSIRO_1653 [Bradyrhizobiaceae bacterium SG-6C]|nr:hypothetical protein CSIRO_1653 [Bradyrhizobiaceae bacterium SG-6C]
MVQNLDQDPDRLLRAVHVSLISRLRNILGAAPKTEQIQTIAADKPPRGAGKTPLTELKQLWLTGG